MIFWWPWDMLGTWTRLCRDAEAGIPVPEAVTNDTRRSYVDSNCKLAALRRRNRTANYRPLPYPLPEQLARAFSLIAAQAAPKGAVLHALPLGECKCGKPWSEASVWHDFEVRSWVPLSAAPRL